MFNISADPGEHIDLAKDPAHASLLAEMIALYEKEVNQTYWQHTEAENYDDCNYGSNCPAQAAMENYGGYCECTLVLRGSTFTMRTLGWHPRSIDMLVC